MCIDFKRLIMKGRVARMRHPQPGRGRTLPTPCNIRTGFINACQYRTKCEILNLSDSGDYKLGHKSLENREFLLCINGINSINFFEVKCPDDRRYSSGKTFLKQTVQHNLETKNSYYIVKLV